MEVITSVKKQIGMASNRLTWILATTGLGTGVLILAIAAWSLNEIRTNRCYYDVVQSDMANLLEELDKYVAEDMIATTTLLDYAQPQSYSERRQELLDALENSVLNCPHRQLFSAPLDSIGSLIVQLKSFHDRCADFSKRYNARVASRAAARKRCDETLRQLNASLASQEGMHMLRLTTKIRRYRRAQGEEATRLAHSILEDWLSGADHGQIKSELADLAMLCERLVGEENEDDLVDLKDNKFQPSFSRLHRSVHANSNRDENRPNLELLNAFETALFGKGFQVDKAHQMVVLGESGLFSECCEWLALQSEKNELIAQRRAYFKDFRKNRDDLVEQVDNLTGEISDEAISSVTTAWNRMAIIGSLCGAVFLFLTTRIARAINNNSLALAEKNALVEQSHEYVKNIIGSMTNTLIVVAPNGTIETVNEATCTLLGYREDELIGQPATLIFSDEEGKEEDLAKVIDSERGLPMKGKMLRTLIRVGHVSNVEGSYLAKDGTSIPVTFSGSVMRDGEGEIQGVVCIAQDSTQQKQLQCELTQAQKLESVGQMAAGIAHEINTPTQYVGDNTRFLKDAFGDIDIVLDKFEKLLEAAKGDTVTEQLVADVEAVLQQADVEYLREEIPQAIDQSLDGVERVAKIVRAMKEFSHPGTEEKSLVNLTEAIETTITVARNEWKYVAEMVTEFDPELPQVACLPGEMNQVFLNLIINAAHAIGDTLGDDATEKGTITVGTRRDGEWVKVFVSDTGTGIPEDIRAKIFDPFFTTKEVGKGTGQGLAIARSVVVDKHGGTLDCETTPGKGTTFIIRMPIDGERQTQGECENEDACTIR